MCKIERELKKEMHTERGSRKEDGKEERAKYKENKRKR